MLRLAKGVCVAEETRKTKVNKRERNEESAQWGTEKEEVDEEGKRGGRGDMAGEERN